MLRMRSSRPWWKSRQAPRPTRRPDPPGATTENVGQYSREEQRRGPGPPRRVVCVVGWGRGCIVGRMPADFHHRLLSYQPGSTSTSPLGEAASNACGPPDRAGAVRRAGCHGHPVQRRRGVGAAGAAHRAAGLGRRQPADARVAGAGAAGERLPDRGGHGIGTRQHRQRPGSRRADDDHRTGRQRHLLHPRAGGCPGGDERAVERGLGDHRLQRPAGGAARVRRDARALGQSGAVLLDAARRTGQQFPARGRQRRGAGEPGDRQPGGHRQRRSTCRRRPALTMCASGR